MKSRQVCGLQGQWLQRGQLLLGGTNYHCTSTPSGETGWESDDEEKEVKERVGGQQAEGIELPWRTLGRKSEAAVTEVRRNWRAREVVMSEETCLGRF